MPPTQPALEEALAALQMGGTASTSTSTTPSAAMSLTPSAPSGPTFGSQALPHLPSRRQTIGFARFRTRADAIAAKEHLQGRKIDSLTGSTLKAEMAKKNLHQKRATSGEELVGLLLRSGRLAGLMNAAGVNPGNQMGQIPMPLQGPGGPNATMMGGGPMQNPPAAARQAWNSWSGQQQPPLDHEKFAQQGTGAFPYPNSLHPTGGAQPPSSHSNSSASPPTSSKSPVDRPSDSKALLALAEEADDLDGWPMGGGATQMGIGLDGFTNSAASAGGGGSIHSGMNDGSSHPSASGSQRQHERSGDSNLAFSPPTSAPQPNPIGIQGNNSMRPNNLQFSQYSRGTEMNMASSPPGGSDRLSESGRTMGGSNPADQNPPVSLACRCLGASS